MLFVFIRLSTFFTTCKNIFPQGTPNIFKVMLCVMMSGIISINLGISVNVDSMYLLMLYCIAEFINGLFFGYVVNLAFSSVKIAGNLIDTQMGLSMANIYDPQTGTQSTLMQSLFNLFAGTLLFVTNGHHLLFGAVFKSFEIISIGSLPIANNLEYVMKIFAKYFCLGFQIAIPVVITLILSDLILALISRSIPQLNVMIIGMPLKLLIGIIIVFVLIPVLSSSIKEMIAALPKILNGYI